MPRSLTLLLAVALCVRFATAQTPPVSDSHDPSEDVKKVEKVEKAPEKLPPEKLEKLAKQAQDATPPKPLPPGAPAPKIHVAKPTFDFGELGQNEEVIHDFEVENVGKGDLEIISAHGSCGCTAVAAPDKKTLKPGEKTAVNVNLKTLTNQGPLSKTITITTNDPVTPNFVCTISGKVAQPFRPTVSELNLGTIQKGKPVEAKTFDVLTNSSQSIVDIKTDNELVKASYTPIPAEEKKQGYRVTVNVDGMLPVGSLRSTVSIGTTVAAQKTIQIPVLALVEGEIAVKPRTFNFGKVKHGETPTKTVEIEKAGKADLKIESVQVKPEGAFTAKLEEVKAGQSYRIVLGIARDAKDGYSRGTVSIKTNCPGETDLQVYFYALLQSDGATGAAQPQRRPTDGN
jgi:hypothetical protein